MLGNRVVLFATLPLLLLPAWNGNRACNPAARRAQRESPAKIDRGVGDGLGQAPPHRPTTPATTVNFKQFPSSIGFNARTGKTRHVPLGEKTGTYPRSPTVVVVTASTPD
ncbi:hypothetical protein GWI33_000671 [Rhynchophorus ferrugineus]|uniref:Secreted protein n=1 Tax=Rhynchophorus ferrugineus TaxID=354439 RepID=A0A834M3T5_RHYFE|nr:hypothetical protein GWI33_000671 [Rhynchophorus ferrugineus]